MLRMIRITVAAIVAAASLAASGGPSLAESELLRLRPLKQPVCAGKADSAKCPAVAAPRINRRRSTIPGTSNPDFGRPPVMVLEPLGKRATNSYRTIGGNRGITINGL